MGDILPFVPPALAPRDPRFIPTPVELVQLAGVWGGDSLPMGWQAEPKIDGIRCIWTDGALYTREGVTLDIPHVAADLGRLERRFGEAMVFDGEYQEPGGFLDTLAWLRGRGARLAAGTFYLFDALPLDRWRADTCQEPLTARRDAVGWAWGDWQPESLCRVPATPVARAGDIAALAHDVWMNGGEGLMLKDGASLYRRKRCAAWRKVKWEMRLSARVVEARPGAPSIRVEVEGRVVRVSVPPALRLTPFVGMTIDVAAMEWTDAGQLRHGRVIPPVVAIGEDRP